MKKLFITSEIVIMQILSKDIITTSGDTYQDNELPLVPISEIDSNIEG